MSKVGQHVCNAFENICIADKKWLADHNYEEVRDLLISAIDMLCQFDGLESNYREGLDWLGESPHLSADPALLSSAKYHYLHGAALHVIAEARITDMFEDYRKDYFLA